MRLQNLYVNGALFGVPLTILTGQPISVNTIDGSTLPPLAAGSKITLAVTQVGVALPGADLTLLIRL